VTGPTTEELAKQVSAFSNSGGGFIVIGIDDVTGRLDGGISDHVGRDTIKQWAEKTIPNLVTPRILGCEARSFYIPPSHVEGMCLLAISVPLSEHRPHWTTSPREVPYIRVGEHSEPMRPQTYLDIAFRSGTTSAEILDLKEVRTPEFLASRATTYTVQPVVCLRTGTVCKDWAFEMRTVEGNTRLIYPRDCGASINKLDHLYVIGKEPLFPGRETPALTHPFQVTHDTSVGGRTLVLRATLYTASGTPVSRTFTLDDLDKNRQTVAPLLGPP
jgi:hypothetical protein